MRSTYLKPFFCCRDELMKEAIKFQSWEFLQTHFKAQKQEWKPQKKHANKRLIGPSASDKIGNLDDGET